MFYDRIIDIAVNHTSRLISAASRVLPPLTSYVETPAINDATVLLFLCFMVLPPK